MPLDSTHITLEKGSNYANKEVERLGRVLGKVSKSDSHNLKYMGIDGLGRLIKISPDIAEEHQLVVIDCLEHVGSFLQSCRFKDSSLIWIPLSAMENQNLVAAPSDKRLSLWYQGPCLLDVVDSVKSPDRDVSEPLLMPICDNVRSSSKGHVSACGKLEVTAIRPGSNIMVMPAGDQGTVRSLERDSQAYTITRAGDNVAIALQGIDANKVMAGGVLCHPDYPVSVATHLELMVLVLEDATPILHGSQLELHVHHAKEATTVVKLLAMLDPKTGEPTKKSPHCLTDKQSALLEFVWRHFLKVEFLEECSLDHREEQLLWEKSLGLYKTRRNPLLLSKFCFCSLDIESPQVLSAILLKSEIS